MVTRGLCVNVTTEENNLSLEMMLSWILWASLGWRQRSKEPLHVYHCRSTSIGFFSCRNKDIYLQWALLIVVSLNDQVSQAASCPEGVASFPGPQENNRWIQWVLSPAGTHDEQGYDDPPLEENYWGQTSRQKTTTADVSHFDRVGINTKAVGLTLGTQRFLIMYSD